MRMVHMFGELPSMLRTQTKWTKRDRGREKSRCNAVLKRFIIIDCCHLNNIRISNQESSHEPPAKQILNHFVQASLWRKNMSMNANSIYGTHTHWEGEESAFRMKRRNFALTCSKCKTSTRRHQIDELIWYYIYKLFTQTHTHELAPNSRPLLSKKVDQRMWKKHQQYGTTEWEKNGVFFFWIRNFSLARWAYKLMEITFDLATATDESEKKKRTVFKVNR